MEILDFIKGREVFVIAIIFIIAMTLYGHYRGFIKMTVSFASVIISLIIVNICMPGVTDFLKTNTGIKAYVREISSDFVLKNSSLSGYGEDLYNDSGENVYTDDGKETKDDDGEDHAHRENEEGDDKLIDSLPLPDMIKEQLKQNNNSDIYELLGVDRITDYISASISDFIINAAAFVIMFILVNIALRIAAHLLSAIAGLPVICGMNQLAGAAIGFAEAIFYIWIFMLVITWIPTCEYSQIIFSQIAESEFLSFIYKFNLISRIILNIFGVI